MGATTKTSKSIETIHIHYRQPYYYEDVYLDIDEEKGIIELQDNGYQFNISVRYKNADCELHPWINNYRIPTENKIRVFISMLGRHGLIINRVQKSDGIIHLEFVRTEKIREIIEKFKALDKVPTKNHFANLRYKGITSKLVGRNTYEIEVGFRGHYVAGSYRHDYTAAADYQEVLKQETGLHFNWLGYDSSNDHQYTFKTTLKI